MDVSSKISAAMSHLAAVASTSSPTPASAGAQPPEREPAAGASEVGASAQLSRPAQLISKLSQLRDSAPDQFKQVVSTVATQLRNVSEQDSGLGAKLLVDLANKLDKAANDAGNSPSSAPGPRAAGQNQVSSLSVTSGEDAAGAAATSASKVEAPPRTAANRAAVDAYRASAAAHPGGERAAARAIESVDAAAVGGTPQTRRR